MLKHVGVTAGLGALAAVAAVSLGARPAAAATSSAVPINKSAVPPGPDSFTDLAGIHAEYRNAVETFPFELPSGVSFPRVSSYRDAVPASLWERGNGEAEAYFFWHNETAAAAKNAYSSANATEANRLLDFLDAGYASPTRRSVWQDTDATFPMALERARNGDFGSLFVLTA